jgi:hypothetical protein
MKAERVHSRFTRPPKFICDSHLPSLLMFHSSSSSQGPRGPSHGQAPSSDADDSFSDSEADAELWAQFRESRQAPPALPASAQHASQAPHKAEKQGKARGVHGPPVVQARQGTAKVAHTNAGGSALHVLEKVTAVALLFLRCMVFVMNCAALLFNTTPLCNLVVLYCLLHNCAETTRGCRRSGPLRPAQRPAPGGRAGGGDLQTGRGH